MHQVTGVFKGEHATYYFVTSACPRKQWSNDGAFDDKSRLTGASITGVDCGQTVRLTGIIHLQMTTHDALVVYSPYIVALKTISNDLVSQKNRNRTSKMTDHDKSYSFSSEAVGLLGTGG